MNSQEFLIIPTFSQFSQFSPKFLCQTNEKSRILLIHTFHFRSPIFVPNTYENSQSCSSKMANSQNSRIFLTKTLWLQNKQTMWSSLISHLISSILINSHLITPDHFSGLATQHSIKNNFANHFSPHWFPKSLPQISLTRDQKSKAKLTHYRKVHTSTPNQNWPLTSTNSSKIMPFT